MKNIYDKGGRRIDPTEPLECSEGCVERYSFKFWKDEVRFIPFGGLPPEDPEPGDPIPDPGPPGPPNLGGVCQLISTNIEVLICDDEKDGYTCDGKSQVLDFIHIADSGADTEILCRLSAFRPFHRTLHINDIHIKAGEAFYVDPGEGAYVYIVEGFVSNYAIADVRISGEQWLGVSNGRLVGTAPIVFHKTEYEFTVTVRNKMGAEAVPFKVVVSP